MAVFDPNNAKAALPLLPVFAAEIGAAVVLTLLDHRAADGAGAGEEVEQRVAIG